jgi:hypothetical protein
MQTPTDFTGVKRLCGMVQYIAAFLPDLANEMEPSRKFSLLNIRPLARFGSLKLMKYTLFLWIFITTSVCDTNPE